jgi:hypothetical protein
VKSVLPEGTPNSYWSFLNTRILMESFDLHESGGGSPKGKS